MGFLDKISGRQKSKPVAEHGVIVHFKYCKENLDPLFALEPQLETALANKNIGDYDGHEIATDYSDGFLYLHGNNAERLFKEIKPILTSTAFMTGAKVKLRFGPPEEGVREIDLIVGREFLTPTNIQPFLSKI